MIFIHWFSIRFWIFAPKIVKVYLFSIFYNSNFIQNHNFWRENSKYSGNFSLRKFSNIMAWLFSLKIQISNDSLLRKTSFWNITWYAICQIQIEFEFQRCYRYICKSNFILFLWKFWVNLVTWIIQKVDIDMEKHLSVRIVRLDSWCSLWA